MLEEVTDKILHEARHFADKVLDVQLEGRALVFGGHKYEFSDNGKPQPGKLAFATPGESLFEHTQKAYPNHSNMGQIMQITAQDSTSLLEKLGFVPPMGIFSGNIKEYVKRNYPILMARGDQVEGMRNNQMSDMAHQGQAMRQLIHPWEAFKGLSRVNSLGRGVHNLANGKPMEMGNRIAAGKLHSSQGFDLWGMFLGGGGKTYAHSPYSTGLNRTSGAPYGYYKPHSPEARALFREAARKHGYPEWWADSEGLHNILYKESKGYVGIPNYTYDPSRRKPPPSNTWSRIHSELKAGRITAKSSATGLGQLLLRNVDAYYPSGRAGIGDPIEEAAGMMAYIKDRYGDPENAWRKYGKMGHEGY